MTTHDPHEGYNLFCGVTSASFEKVGQLNHNVWMCVCTNRHVLCVYQRSMIHCGSQEQKGKKKGNTWSSPCWRDSKCVRKKKVQRWCERTVNNERFFVFFFKCAIVDAHRQETERRADLWAAREWFEQIGLCLPAPPLPLPVFSFPLQQASGGDRTVWKPHSQHAHTNSPPTSSSCLISMQPGRWYSNSVQRYDLINGIWLPARIPETSMAFWKSEGWDGREEGVLGGRRCLASRGRVLPIRLWKRRFPLTPEDERGCDRVLHLTQREGGGRRGANKHGMSNCLWTNLFSLWLAGRPAHLCDTELCVNAAIWGEVPVDGSASAKWVESWSQIKTDQAHTPPGPLTDINLVYGEERRARVSIFCFNCYFKVTDELRLTQSLKLKKKWFARRWRETQCLKPFQTPTQQR